jgi:hypothetical protein
MVEMPNVWARAQAPAERVGLRGTGRRNPSARSAENSLKLPQCAGPTDAGLRTPSGPSMARILAPFGGW